MDNETLGQVFKRYRQAENLKLERIEKDIKISQRMLLALENDDYQQLPDEFYTRNIIKAYAKYLELDYNKLLILYDKGRVSFGLNEKNATLKSARVYLTPQRIRLALIVLLIFGLLGYFGWQIKNIFTPPELFIFQPALNLIITENFYEIKGQTEKEATVYINDKEVFLDPQGKFSATLDLQKGLNYIKITAVKKHGQTKTLAREILVQE